MPPKATATAKKAARGLASYVALIQSHPLRPIRSGADLDEAVAVLDRLLQPRRKPLTTSEQDYFDVLTLLIEQYEEATILVPDVAGAEMLKHLIDANDKKLSEVAEATGVAISTLSDIVNKKRDLNFRHALALAPFFGVEPAVFLPSAEVD